LIRRKARSSQQFLRINGRARGAAAAGSLQDVYSISPSAAEAAKLRLQMDSDPLRSAYDVQLHEIGSAVGIALFERLQNPLVLLNGLSTTRS
jgi:hypothetical protein